MLARAGSPTSTVSADGRQRRRPGGHVGAGGGHGGRGSLVADCWPISPRRPPRSTGSSPTSRTPPGSAPTPAEGWTVAHQIAHLAWTDEQALLAATEPEGFRRADRRGRAAARTAASTTPPAAGATAPGQLLGPVAGGRAALAEALAALPDGAKLPWFGPPMSAASMATARIMETWAHGQDIADALGVRRGDRPAAARRAHRRPHARTSPSPRTGGRARRAVPGGADRARTATLWTWGPEDAAQRVTGPALDFCLLVTQRRHRADLALQRRRAPTPTRGSTSPRPSPVRPGRAGRRRERRAVTAPLRIGNASGFYGDRFAAVREMLDGGPLDVLTGDYLAELTMLILGRDRLKDPARGTPGRSCGRWRVPRPGPRPRRADRDQRRRAQPGRPGRRAAGAGRPARAAPRVAHVEGDDLLARAAELGLGTPLTANAYLGALGIAECLRAGADVVVTGRVTDASLVVGPGIAHFGWARDDFDALAGAVVAGHVLECGAQATGGNYSVLHRAPAGALLHPGFPIAEIAADGSSVITKHPGTGGVVTVGTVTAQLLYEIGGPRYAGPDVVARFDTIGWPTTARTGCGSPACAASRRRRR